MNRKIPLLCFFLILCTICSGCGTQVKSKKQPLTEPAEASIPVTEAIVIPSESTEPTESYPTPVRPAPSVDPQDGNELLSLDNHMSIVEKTSDDGCVVLPYNRWVEGDQIIGGCYDPDLVEGNDEYLRVTIQYEPDCTFLHASYSIWTYAVNYKPAAKSDIERKNTLIVYGEYDSDHILHADRVYIIEELR